MGLLNVSSVAKVHCTLTVCRLNTRTCRMFRSSTGAKLETGEAPTLAVGDCEKPTGSKRSRFNVPLNGLISFSTLQFIYL
jgi:hypothetical protein